MLIRGSRLLLKYINYKKHESIVYRLIIHGCHNMQIYNLQFATIVALQDQIAEVIIRRDIELDLAMVETFHEFLRDHFTAPMAILINKKYVHTYTFEAQQELATIPEISAIGILTYSALSQEFSRAMINQPRSTPWNAELFEARDPALEWIAAQLNLEQPATSFNAVGYYYPSRR